MKHRVFWFAVMAGILLLFMCGMAVLFQWRFETGDIYPPYSTLRTDPMGAKGFFESLERLRTLQPRRNFAPWEQAGSTGGATWFFLGADQQAFTEEWPAHRQALEKLARNQGRLVIIFQTEHQAPQKSKFPKPAKLTTGTAPVSLEQAWGFHFGHEPLPKENEHYQPVNVRRKLAAPLPENLSWHSALYFSQPGKEWRVVYARDEKAVVMERALGEGTLVLATDPFLVSNEALRTARPSMLLSWFIGGNAVAVFDERHLGVSEEPGMGTLLRQYRLHGMMASLLLLAALFVWKNATSLVPARAEEATGVVVAGLDSSAGFLNLLRRGVAPKELPRVCLEEWKSRGPRAKTHQADRLARMEAAISAEAETSITSRNPVRLYRKLCALAAEKTNIPPGHPSSAAETQLKS
jgi:hypothetical protein